jgi:hypothetical protein
MKKSFLIGTGNDGYRYKYEFFKTNDFERILVEFLFAIGFDESFIWDYFWDFEYGDEHKDFSSYEDKTLNFYNELFDIEVFFGKNLIIMIVRTKVKEGFIDIVDDLFKFEGEKK